MQRMYFKNGDYNPNAINITVRNGDYWYKRLKFGDEFIFWQTGIKKEKRPIMTVTLIAFKNFGEIPPPWFECHHCHSNSSDVFEDLKKTYPKFHYNSAVTIIGFRKI